MSSNDIYMFFIILNIDFIILKYFISTIITILDFEAINSDSEKSRLMEYYTNNIYP